LVLSESDARRQRSLVAVVREPQAAPVLPPVVVPSQLHNIDSRLIEKKGHMDVERFALVNHEIPVQMCLK
jgi:hypothetical protein